MLVRAGPVNSVATPRATDTKYAGMTRNWPQRAGATVFVEADAGFTNRAAEPKGYSRYGAGVS